MKLVSCYVENYGKIQRREFRFNQTITSFHEPNGTGKTTLASFLKAMLYGLDGYNKRSAFSERKHFYPFEGGEFGGNLVFEKDGKQYKIERFFGEKSETADTLKVYVNGKETDEFGDEVGKALLGLDRESFERTAFIGSDEIEIASTSSINAKLGGFLQGTGDDFDLTAAIEALEKKSKIYKKSKKGEDYITRETDRVNALKEKIANAETIGEALKEKYLSYDETMARVKELDGQIERGSTQNERASNREHYETLLARVQNGKAKIKALEEKYPFGVPQKAETERVQELLFNDEKLRAQAENKTFTDADEYRLASYEAVFQGGAASEEQMQEAQKALVSAQTLERELLALAPKEKTEEEKRLFSRFNAYLPPDEAVRAAENKVEEYRAAERKYLATNAYASANATPQTLRAKPYAFSAVFAVLLLIAGAACLGAGVIGAVLLAVGGVWLLGTGFAYLNKKSSLQTGGEAAKTTEKREAEYALSRLEDEIKAFLLPFGYPCENVVYSFGDFKADWSRYQTAIDEEEKRAALFASKTREKEALDGRLTAFFASFGLRDTDYAKNLSELARAMAEYAALCERKKRFCENAAAFSSARKENRVGILSYCERYGQNPETLGETVRFIAQDAREYERAKEELAKDEHAAQKYKEEKRLTEEPSSERVDLSGLNAEKTALQNKLGVLKNAISQDEYEAEKLDGFLQEKERAEQLLAEYKKKHRLLTATVDFLKEADERLKDKYIKPIKDKFIEFSELLEKTLGEKVTMNANFEISFDRFGKERSEKHLSSGQRSLCALCFRLALIENMYAKEKPFLILDDPFTSLDEAHLEKVKALIKNFAPHIQIVYFSCHESRAI